MTRRIKMVVGFWLALGTVPPATALDCGRAVSAIEKTVCREPDLARLDGELNRLYASLRTKVTIRVRTDLLEQQRAWLAERDHTCTTGDANCLQTQYSGRLDQLHALIASADTVDGKLDDITPVIVKGKWKATAIKDAAAAKLPTQAALAQALADANLPAFGATLTTAPGKLCLPSQPCDAMGWTRKTLSEVNGGEAIGRQLGLSSTRRVLTGSSGATHSYYLLVPQEDGSMWAVFILCGEGQSDCRHASETLFPASPDAGVLPHS